MRLVLAFAIFVRRGAVAQLGERLTGSQKVRGSTPPLRLVLAFAIFVRRGAVAQLGERLNGIEEVRGSTPLSSTILYDI